MSSPILVIDLEATCWETVNPAGQPQSIESMEIIEFGCALATRQGDLLDSRSFLVLLSAILGDAINLGLTKMAESSPGLTYAKLSWLQAWHIRDETYSGSVPAEGEMTP